MTSPLYSSQYVQTQYHQYMSNCETYSADVNANYMANQYRFSNPNPTKMNLNLATFYQRKNNNYATNYHCQETDSTAADNVQNIDLPQYQSRQNKMLSVLHQYETLPMHTVSGFIREIDQNSNNEYIIPQDLVNLCFQFYQHSDIAKLIDSKTCDELYTISWEATENEDYLFAEQIIHYLVQNNESCKDASTTNLMAVIQYFMKDYTNSEKYFRIAAKIDPKCDIIMNNYAVLLLEEHRYSDAEQQICAAINCNPECIKNHEQYAYILYCMGKYEEAAKECRLMILLQPNIESYSGYAWLLEQMGQFEESVSQYMELIKLEPNNYIWYYWYAVLLQRCQKYEASMINFETCLSLRGTDKWHEGVNGNYAYSLYLNRKYESAYKYIRIAVSQERDCQHLCVHYYYAVIMIQLNQTQTAVNELYQCLDLINSSNNVCKKEKGCLIIDMEHILAFLAELGY